MLRKIQTVNFITFSSQQNRTCLFQNMFCVLAVVVVTIISISCANVKKVQSDVYQAPEWTQQKRVKNQPLFKVKNPDFAVSPYTGMTRQHWKDAALYLLNGAFSYIDQIDDPMQFPKQSAKGYPRNPGQVPTEKLEGLCRTLFVAAPLLKENPTLTLNNIPVGEYYRHHITKLLDTASPTYIKHRSRNGGPSQILVEFGALGLSLFVAPEVIWEPLTKQQKDALAATMLSYGDGPTVGSNWKFFNIFVLSFFKDRGYQVNEKLLVEYLDKSLAHYRGSGWYNDAPAYDYYSMWAFQMYGPIWSEFFGKKYYPGYAKKFMQNFSDLTKTYPYLFSRNGNMIMWGRSMPYRFASVVPFPLMGLLNDPAINYGWMRRIASGVMLQFLTHPQFMEDNIPTLGFYDAFEPVVQPYSCRGSVFWMGKAFLGLLIPENNPFWTAKENEGAWENELQKGTVINKFQDSSNILITDYPNIGASEIRAWCHVKAIGANEPFRASENYNRLSYNSAFPWQADSVEGVVAMNYIVKNTKGEWEPFRLYTFKKFEEGVYYRDVVLETNKNVQFNLADVLLPNGILRIDRNNSTDAAQIRLGHYALPKKQGAIKTQRRNVKGHDVEIISNGEYQLAIVPVTGWDSIQTTTMQGVHPESAESAVINVKDNYKAARQPKIYTTLMLWKRAKEAWTDDELVPVVKTIYDPEKSSVEVWFVNGDRKTITFD